MVLWILGMISGIIFIYFSNLLEVNIIEVTGLASLNQDEVEAVVREQTLSNIFLLDMTDLQEHVLSRVPELEYVRIERSYFPNKLMLSVIERQPVISWHTGSGIYLVDRQGIVLGYDLENVLPQVYAFGAYPQTSEEVAEESNEATVTDETGEEIATSPDLAEGPDEVVDNSELELQVLQPGDQVADEFYISYLLSLFSELPPLMEENVLYAEQGEIDDVAFSLESGVKIHFSTIFTLDSELERLSKTLSEAEREQKPIYQYVDLRFEKVYFK